MNKKARSAIPFYWHAFLVCSLIFSQPLFEKLGNQPEFLLAHNLAGLNLLLWILAVSFSPGLLLVSLIYILTKIFTTLREKIKTGSLFLLLSLFTFTLIDNSIGTGLVLPIAVSCILAILTLVIYGKSLFIRTFFSYAAFMVVIIPVIFSFKPDVRQILLPQGHAGKTISAESIDKQPVVILLFDEFPLFSLLDSDGNINDQRFPNIANFSTHSTWYKYATSIAEATLIAVPPILTGQLTKASDKKLPLAANYPENLFTLLSASHEINAFETFTQICPENLCKSVKLGWRVIAEDTLVVLAHIVAPDQFKQNLPQIDNKWVGYMRSDDVQKDLHTDRSLHPHHRYKVRLEKLGQFMSALEFVDSASVNYLHILMPHSPWAYLPDGRVYSNAELRPFIATLPAGAEGLKQASQLYSQPHLIEYAHQRHLLQLGYVDKLLGEVFALLHKREIFDDALIIVMADHGASFEPGESLREANEPSYQDILSIPLFIKYPGQTHAEVSLRTARTVDVLPTILDVLNSEFSNPDFDGQSLLKNDFEEQTTLGLQRDTGKILQFQLDEFKSRFEQTLKNRKSALTNGSFDQIYALNDHGLLNKTVQQLPAGDPVNYTLILDNPQLYENIDQTQASIPTLIRASHISAQPETPTKATVAVSVNGSIRGVSILQTIETVEFDFQVLVAPESFQNGSNSIQFYQVNENGDALSLSPILFATNSVVEIINETEKTISLSLDSQRLPVARTGDHGQLMLIADDKANQVRLTGWSARSDNGQIASEIFFFSGNTLFASVKPHTLYPQAREVTGFENTEYSGFNLIIPIDSQQKSGPESLTAIAVFNPETNPTAGELRYVNQAKQLFKTRNIKRRRPIEEIPNKEAIELSRVYDFSDATQADLFRGDGWSKTDGWNIDDEASLNFNAKSNEFSLRLILEISPFFVKGTHEIQNIVVSFPSGGNQSIRLERGVTKNQIAIPIATRDIGPDGKTVINLTFPDASSPESLGVNDDPRLLAINVKTIQVLIAEPAAN